MITHSTLLTEIEHIIYLILFGYPSIIILVKFEERAFWLWNICLVPKRQRNGEFLKDEYRYFVAKIAYRAFQNWGICGWYQKTRKNLLIWERNNIKCRYNKQTNKPYNNCKWCGCFLCSKIIFVWLLPIRNTVNTRLFGAYKPEKIIFDLSHYAKSRPAWKTGGFFAWIDGKEAQK